MCRPGTASRYPPILPISADIRRYPPIFADICRYLPISCRYPADICQDLPVLFAGGGLDRFVNHKKSCCQETKEQEEKVVQKKIVSMLRTSENGLVTIKRPGQVRLTRDFLVIFQRYMSCSALFMLTNSFQSRCGGTLPSYLIKTRCF